MATYEYPLNPDWSTDEIVVVIDFLSAVEAVYESGVRLDQLTARYQAFKQIVTSIGEEKRLDRSFQAASGYSIYQVVQRMRALKAEGKPQALVRIQ